MTEEGQIYIWGTGVFGQFFTPHRVKAIKGLNIRDFKLSKCGQAVILTSEGKLYSWGFNAYGQLGHGDFNTRASPELI
jgi:alpha-tubulin suppressor-like RCC1 family protein